MPRHTQATRLTEDMIELAHGPGDPGNLTILRNGSPMQPGRDYNAAEGDLCNFVKRCGGEPWTAADQFIAEVDE